MSRWITVGATQFSANGGGGSCGNLGDGHFHYAELGRANRINGAATGYGWLALALGVGQELPCGYGLWIRYRDKTTYATLADIGYGQGGDGYRSDSTWKIDLLDNTAGYLGFPGKDYVQVTNGDPGKPAAISVPDLGAVATALNPSADIDDVGNTMSVHGNRTYTHAEQIKFMVRDTHFVTFDGPQ